MGEWKVSGKERKRGSKKGKADHNNNVQRTATPQKQRGIWPAVEQVAGGSIVFGLHKFSSSSRPSLYAASAALNNTNQQA